MYYIQLLRGEMELVTPLGDPGGRLSSNLSCNI